MNSFGQKVAQAPKNARQTAVSIAKKVAQDHLESLKGQLGAPEPATQNQESPEFVPTQSQAGEYVDPAYDQMKAQDNARSKQLLQQLEAEIEKIRQEKKQKQLMQTQQEEQVKVQQVQQEEKKKETMMQKVGKIIKGRIAGKREMQKNASG